MRENQYKKKFYILAIFFVILFLGVIVKLSHTVFVKGDIYKAAAYSQQTKSQIISPSRGTIYDANGEVLASSVMVDTVSFKPGGIKYSNGKEVEEDVIAKKFSELFTMNFC